MALIKPFSLFPVNSLSQPFFKYFKWSNASLNTGFRSPSGAGGFGCLQLAVKTKKKS